MIRALLSRLCEVPQAAFAEQELRQWGVEAFNELKQSRFLRPGPTHKAGDSVWRDGRFLTLLEAPGGGLEGIDLDDPGVAAATLSSEELATWELDLEAVIRAIRDQNGLTGPSRHLSDTTWLIGTTTDEKGATWHYILAMVVDDPGATGDLLTTKATLQSTHTVAVCPVFELDHEQRGPLEASTIFVVAFDDSFSVPKPNSLSFAPAITIVLDDWFASGYRSILWDGAWKPLSTNQARVVELLHKAGTPLTQDDVLEELEIGSKNLYQVFRGCWAWKTLVQQVGPSLYRLNAPTMH